MVARRINTDFWKNRKVLVTGHTGFKGSWLCMYLIQLNAKVTGYALTPPTQPSLFQLCELDQLIDSRLHDIRDYGQLDKVIDETRPEIIIHMAAQSLVWHSYDRPVETYEVNVMGTVNLLESVRHHNFIKAVVNVTSDKCYENRESLRSYREDDPLGGHDPYSNSKACAELVTAAYNKSFFNPGGQTAVATARAGNVIGGGDWADKRLVPDFIRAILNKQNLQIRNPDSIRPWQHVLEPLTGYLLLAEKLYDEGAAFTGAWNFGPDESDAKTVQWIADKLCSIWGNGVIYEIAKSPAPHEASYLKLDNSKAKNLLNWYPKWDLETALTSIMNFTKAYIAGEKLYKKSVSQIDDYLNYSKQ